MLDGLLDQVKRMIFNSPATQHQQGHDPDGLIEQIQGLFGQHQNELQRQYPNVRPASEDPYGDPADQYQGGYSQSGYAPDPRQQFPNLRPASEDPLGDPADQQPAGYGERRYVQGDLRQQFPNLRPASEDPLGDPADQR